YSSWERGTNENINAMIRRFIPKGTDINKVTKKQVQIVQDWINNYPRKLLHSTSQIEFTKFLSDLHKSA
ncbi:MAG: IS30 family transposase, partial [Ruthenibacterium sp.]